MSPETKKYKVLGEEGTELAIDGVNHPAGSEVELTEEQATTAGAAVELVKAAE